MPLFVVVGGVGGDIVEVNLTPKGASVEMSLNSKKSFSKEAVREAIFDKLREEGVDPKGLVLNYKF